MRSETKLAAASLMDMSSDYTQSCTVRWSKQGYNIIHSPERERIEHYGELGG
jgi:hypothetical protein